MANKKYFFLVALFWGTLFSLALQGVEKGSPDGKKISQKAPSLILPDFLSVHPQRGSLGLSFVDFAFKGGLPRLALRRAYVPSFRGLLGRGWKLDIETSLVVFQGGILLIDYRGKEILFHRDVQGIFRSTKGIPARLNKLGEKSFQIQWKNGEKWIFDLQGRLISKVNRHNRGVKIHYKSRLPQKIEDSSGRFIEFSYDQQGRMIGAKDWMERRMSYRYNSQGRLASTGDYSGRRYGFFYKNQRLAQLSTPFQGTFEFKYNEDGKIGKIQKDLQTLFSYQYKKISQAKQVTTIRDGLGRTQKISFSQKKDSQIIAYQSYSIELDGRDDLRCLTTPQGKYRFVYDENRNLISLTNPQNKTMRYRYDSQNRLQTLWDLMGFQTKFCYDKTGNLKEILSAGGNATQFQWNGRGDLVGVINSLGQKISFERDSLGNVTKTIDGLGRVVKRSYDGLGRVRSITGETGAWVRISYDDNNLPRQISNSAGQTLKYSYDKAGNLVQATAPNGAITRYTYDPEGNLLEIKNSLGIKTRLDYDRYGNLISMILPGKRKIQFGYNDRGNLVRATTLEGKTLHYQYDGMGKLVGITYPDGQKSRLFWDSLGRLIKIKYPENESKITYDAMGRILSMKNRDSHLSYKRDGLGRVVEAKDLILKKSVGYRYDKGGKLASLLTPFGKIRHQFNSVGWLKKLSLGKKNFRFSYHPSGALAELSTPNHVVSSWIYNGAGRLVELITRRGKNVFQREKYTYDSLSNRTTIQTLSGSTSFQYDKINQLVQMQKGTDITKFQYDPFKNLIKKTVGTRLVRLLTKDDKIIQQGQTKFSYDSFGRLSERTNPQGKRKYKYDYEGRLVSIEEKGLSIRYGYSVDGRLVFRECNGKKTSYLYDGNNIIGEYEKGKLKVAYIHGPEVDMPLAMIYQGHTYYYHRDGAWNITGMTDEKGKVVARYGYDVFGRLIQSSGSLKINPYLFAGRRFDRSANLYYYRARFYDPSLGRFLTPDSLGYSTGLNRYIYCGNNPVNFRDPSGEFLHILGAAAVGALIQGGLDLGFQLWENGGNFKEVDWGRVAGSAVLGAVAGGVGAATMGLSLAGTFTGSVALGAGIMGVAAGIGKVTTNGWHRYIDKKEVKLTKGVGGAVAMGAIMGGTFRGLFFGLNKAVPNLKRLIPWFGGKEAGGMSGMSGMSKMAGMGKMSMGPLGRKTLLTSMGTARQLIMRNKMRKMGENMKMKMKDGKMKMKDGKKMKMNKNKAKHKGATQSLSDMQKTMK